MNFNMEYKMEELVPIVARLSEKYTSGESSSITYEKAEQLMEAVLYCIHELEQNQGKMELIVCQKQLTAQEAYDMGYQILTQKVKDTIALYHTILEQFDAYGNRCLYDTFVKGMPEFFKWYDVRFAPQDTILTLDYPIMIDLQGTTGIDAIRQYLECILLEQSFLGKMPSQKIYEALSQYCKDYKGMIENLCFVVFSSILKESITVLTMEKAEIFTKQFVKHFYKGDKELERYLQKIAADVVVYQQKC